MLKEEKSSFLFTTIRVLPHQVALRLGNCPCQGRVASRLRQSGNLLSLLEDQNSHLLADPAMLPMATATLLYSTLRMESISILILLLHQTHLLTYSRELLSRWNTAENEGDDATWCILMSICRT